MGKAPDPKVKERADCIEAAGDPVTIIRLKGTFTTEEWLSGFEEQVIDELLARQAARTKMKGGDKVNVS